MKKESKYIPTDMHTNGVRFTKKQKEKLREEREKQILKEEYCHYSGLPSPKAYESE